MKQEAWLMAVLCLGAAGTLAALDRDFRAVGDGKDAPQELTVYRRADGYTVLVKTDGRPAAVTAAKNGRQVFTLAADGSVTAGGKTVSAVPVVREKTLWGYFIPDKTAGIGQYDLVDLTAQYAGSKAVLPDASGAPLRVSARKGYEYDWNLEESTILDQVSNTRVTFTDFRYDVCSDKCADLVSGSAEVKDGKLLLTAVLREPVSCTMRVHLDTVPGAGYSADGADYMLDNAELSQFTGKNAREWKWTAAGKVHFRKDGAKYTWEIPLRTIRPAETGRLRLRFSARTKSGTDEMPSAGKVLPVLRPGNLAADPATKLIVSGCCPMYKAYPLTDGQTSRRIHWCFESWAANDEKGTAKFVEFRFPQPVTVRQAVIWWEDCPDAAELQILDKDGKWFTVLSCKGAGSSGMDWHSAETGAAVADPAKEKLKKAEKSVLPFPAGTVTRGVRLQDPKSLWIREIEIY